MGVRKPPLAKIINTKYADAFQLSPFAEIVPQIFDEHTVGAISTFWLPSLLILLMLTQMPLLLLLMMLMMLKWLLLSSVVLRWIASCPRHWKYLAMLLPPFDVVVTAANIAAVILAIIAVVVADGVPTMNPSCYPCYFVVISSNNKTSTEMTTITNNHRWTLSKHQW